MARPKKYINGFKCIYRSVPNGMVPHLDKWIAENRGRFEANKYHTPTSNFSVKKDLVARMEPIQPIEQSTKQTQLDVPPTIDFTGEKYLNIERYTKYPLSQRPVSLVDRPAWDKKKKEYDDKIRQQWNTWKLKIQLSQ